MALQFLTVIPFKVNKVSVTGIVYSLAWFPLAGLLLGLLLTAVNFVLIQLNFSNLAGSVILVVMLACITGAMHLDGLADTFDGIFHSAGKEERLRIMRDPHIGAMGVVSIVSVLLLKVSILSALSQYFKPTALILMCVLSRWSVVLAMFKFPYAREDGKVKVFTENINLKIFSLATILALLLAFIIWQAQGLLLLAAIGIFSLLFSKFVHKKIGGITGDTLGALLELSEVIALAGCLLITNIWR